MKNVFLGKPTEGSIGELTFTRRSGVAVAFMEGPMVFIGNIFLL
jgi:hypothetical protein